MNPIHEIVNVIFVRSVFRGGLSVQKHHINDVENGVKVSVKYGEDHMPNFPNAVTDYGIKKTNQSLKKE